MIASDNPVKHSYYHSMNILLYGLLFTVGVFG